MQHTKKLIGIDLHNSQSTVSIIEEGRISDTIHGSLDMTACDAVVSVSSFMTDDDRRYLISQMAMRGIRVMRLISNMLAACVADRERLNTGMLNHVLGVYCAEESIEVAFIDVEDDIFEMKGAAKLGITDDPQGALAQYLKKVLGDDEDVDATVDIALKEIRETGSSTVQGKLKTVTINKSKLEELFLGFKEVFKYIPAAIEKLGKIVYYSDILAVTHIIFTGNSSVFDDPNSIDKKIKNLYPKASVKLDSDGSPPSRGAAIHSSILGGVQLRDIPTDSILVLDTTMLGVYIQDNQQKYELIQPATTIPCKMSHNITSTSAVEVYQKIEDGSYKLVQTLNMMSSEIGDEYDVDVDANGILYFSQKSKTISFISPHASITIN